MFARPFAQRPTGPAKMIVLVAIVLLVGLLTACSGGEKKSPAAESLDQPGGTTTAASDRKTWAGTTPAPEFPEGLDWLNVSRPLTLADLRGRAVLLDFWTLGCINCQHVVPDLKRLEEEFGDRLVVIGVHSGKYATEHEIESIRDAAKRLGLEHAVVNDPDFAVWGAYGANAWPTLVLIDPAGNIVGGHAGEGVYPLFQPILHQLLEEFAARDDVPAPLPIPLALDATPVATVLSYPAKVVGDDAGGRLFIADAGHNRILISSIDGRLQRAIGSGEEGLSDGPADKSTFAQPQGLTLSRDGKTLYVADTRNHAIRAVDLTSGEVSTIAGTGQQLDRLPAAGAKGRTTALGSPWDVLEREGKLYIAMAGVHQIWVLDLASNEIGVFAGTSREGIQDGARRTEATLAQPSGLASDERYLYWVDPESSAVRRVPFAGDGEVETLAGTGLFDYGDEDGPRETARLQHPQGIVALTGTLYIGDTYNHKLRTVDPARFITGSAAGDGIRGRVDGVRDDAQFDEPAGLGVAGGRIYIADQNNHLVRIFDPATGAVSTLQLSNLAILGSSTGISATRIELPGQAIAAGAGTLRIVVETPPNHHLNSQAPGRLALTTSDGGVFQPGDREISWSTDDATVTITIPADFHAGSATLTASGQVYYCRSGEEALCFIRPVEIVLPVTVRDGASAGEAVLRLELPPG